MSNLLKKEHPKQVTFHQLNLEVMPAPLFRIKLSIVRGCVLPSVIGCILSAVASGERSSAAGRAAGRADRIHDVACLPERKRSSQQHNHAKPRPADASVIRMALVR